MMMFSLVENVSSFVRPAFGEEVPSLWGGQMLVCCCTLYPWNRAKKKRRRIVVG
jgi:hypothetical protein